MLTRRGFLGGSLAAFACGRAPLVRTKQPTITHGVQSGDPQTGRAIVWARCDEPARMLVEWDTTARFDHPRRVIGPIVAVERGLSGTVVLDRLPDAQTIAYRVRFEREAARGASAWVAGRFATPRPDRVRVAWTGDTCGQGYGRNPEWGGLKGFSAIRATSPDVFVNSGDLIYADNPIVADKRLADGRVWRNLTNERVARVAESLDDFRARFAYNFEDDHLRALAADVPVIAQWDDHETRNNWWPGQRFDDERYARVRDASLLASHALTATREWTPIGGETIYRAIDYGPLLDVFVLDCRSYRSPNVASLDDAAMLGDRQLRWLADALVASTKRWKLIACDQPIALVIEDDDRFEGFANRDPGAPRGRELELARFLEITKAVRNVAWITADVHYAAAHHFDPARAARDLEFAAFWEFVAGPIHAGNFGPNELDPTFGPEVRFRFGTPPVGADTGPWDGLQSFGTLDVTRDALAVALWNIDGREQYRVEIPYVA